MKAYNKYEVDEIFSSWQSDLEQLSVLEVYTKSDIVAMFTDLQLEIEEIDSRAGYDGNGMPTFANDYVRIIKVNEIIQQKINALKGEENVDKA